MNKQFFLSLPELYLSDRIVEVEDRIDPLKFYRDHVSKNLPLLIKNGIKNWKATNQWSSSYFRKVMPDKEVSVAVTPNGYADAIATDKFGNEYFVQPEERTIKISEFLDELDNPKQDEIFYIQRQNSNFEMEYSELWRDVEQDLSWATESIGKNPDAINFWMGDQRAVTSSKFFIPSYTFRQNIQLLFISLYTLTGFYIYLFPHTYP